MSREQRWAASGVVVLLGALWGGLAGLVALGLTAVWLFLGR